MSEFENIQRLIQLKRFEKPEEGFTEEFLHQFHQRQRAEMLKQSSLQLFWERTATWWNNLLVPKWGIAAAASAVCVMSLWMFTHSGNASAPSVTSIPAVVPVVEEITFIPKMDLSDLPLARMAERNGENAEDLLLRNQLEVRPVLEGTVSPLPASGWQAPSIKNAVPATSNGPKYGEGAGK